MRGCGILSQRFTLETRRIPMFKQFGLVALVFGAFVSTAAQAANPVVIAPSLHVGGPVYAEPVRRMSPERFEQLKSMMEERSGDLLGPAPEGLRHEEYQYLDRRPAGGPCRPGYHEVKHMRDPELRGRVHFRCVLDGGVSEADGSEE